MSSPTPVALPADFDFIIGDWQVHHHRLNTPWTFPSSGASLTAWGSSSET